MSSHVSGAVNAHNTEVSGAANTCGDAHANGAVYKCRCAYRPALQVAWWPIGYSPVVGCSPTVWVYPCSRILAKMMLKGARKVPPTLTWELFSRSSWHKSHHHPAAQSLETLHPHWRPLERRPSQSSMANLLSPPPTLNPLRAIRGEALPAQCREGRASCPFRLLPGET